jgi:elongation factor Ts
MQVAAMNPMVVGREDVAAAQVAKQKEIFEAQLKEEKKPEQAWSKILDGKLAKWFTEVTLLGQDNVWDPPAGTIDKIRQELGKKLGGEVKVHAFVRFSLGEGIEKPPPEDFAAEVAKLGG